MKQMRNRKHSQSIHIYSGINSGKIKSKLIQNFEKMYFKPYRISSIPTTSKLGKVSLNLLSVDPIK